MLYIILLFVYGFVHKSDNYFIHMHCLLLRLKVKRSQLVYVMFSPVLLLVSLTVQHLYPLTKFQFCGAKDYEFPWRHNLWTIPEYDSFVECEFKLIQDLTRHLYIHYHLFSYNVSWWILCYVLSSAVCICIFDTFHKCSICQYSWVTRGLSTVFLFIWLLSSVFTVWFSHNLALYNSF